MKKNWQPKSVFLAFTIPTEGDGKIVRRMVGRFGSRLDFEFNEKEKSFMEFRNQIGLVSRSNFRHYQLIF